MPVRTGIAFELALMLPVSSSQKSRGSLLWKGDMRMQMPWPFRTVPWRALAVSAGQAGVSPAACERAASTLRLSVMTAGLAGAAGGGK